MTDIQMLKDKMNSVKVIFKDPAMDLFEELFTADCDYITFTGQHIKGIEENYTIHKALTGSWLFRGAELVLEIKQIKFLHESVAVVIAAGAIKFRWQKKIKENRMSINTNVFVKQHGQWKLASFQNTRIKPPGSFVQRFLLQRLTGTGQA